MDGPIWVGCDAHAIMKLINQGMDLAQRSSLQNETVLHYWSKGPYNFFYTNMNDGSICQEESLTVVKLLINKGADLLAVNSWGFTPLLNAANGRGGDRPNLKVLDYLLERGEYSRAEKIEAMELAGAVILNKETNALLFPRAFDYWRKTLHLRRQMGEDDSGFIEKMRLNLKNVQATEWNSSAELEYVMEHPDKCMIQSFLVQLRIFTSKNWNALSSLFYFAVQDDFFRQLQHPRRFQNLFDIIWAILETLLSRSDLRENKDAQWKTASVFELLIQVFSRLDRDSPDFWTEEIITTSLNLMVSAAELHYPVFCVLIKFVKILSHLPHLLLNKDAIQSLSKVRHRCRGNLLQQLFSGPIDDGNLYATVRLLLNAGCDPNAYDEYGSTPLHYLAQLDERYWFSTLDVNIQLLLDFGAQLGQMNAYGRTAVDLWKQTNGRLRSRNEDKDQGIVGLELPDWCTELPRLTCLSARVIRRDRIQYSKLPFNLISMIEKHKITQ